MRTIQISKNPLCLNHDMYASDVIDIQSGLTVLVGCNGCGKTTFLTLLRTVLQTEKVPFIEFDNLLHGGNNAREEARFRDDMSFLIQSVLSSEGENIVLNMARIAAKIGNFVKENPEAKELWILMDAVDSGLSIDNIDNVKKCLFAPILNDPRNANRNVYIVVSANTFEMVSDANCLDVQEMKYCKFSSYEEYRDFILKSKEKKMLRNSQIN